MTAEAPSPSVVHGGQTLTFWTAWFSALSLAWLASGSWLLLAREPVTFDVDDSFAHALLGAAGGMVIGLIFVPRGSRLLTAAVAIAVPTVIGIGFELAQPVVAERNAEAIDAAWTAAGAALAGLVCVVVVRLERTAIVVAAVSSVLVLTASAATLALAVGPEQGGQLPQRAAQRIPAAPTSDDPETATTASVAPPVEQVLPPIVGLPSIAPVAGEFVEPGAEPRTDCLEQGLLEPVPGPAVPGVISGAGEPVVAADLTVTPALVTGTATGPGSPLLALGVDGLSVSEQGTEFDGDDAALVSAGAASRLTQVLANRQAVAIELVVATADLDRSGPARILTFSDGHGANDVNLHVGQSGDALAVRIRVACDVVELLVPAVFVDFQPRHVVVAAADRRLLVAVDGVVLFDDEIGPIRFDLWSQSFHLLVGNEATQMRPFAGTIRWFTILAEPVDADRVARRFEAVSSALGGADALGAVPTDQPWPG